MTPNYLTPVENHKSTHLHHVKVKEKRQREKIEDGSYLRVDASVRHVSPSAAIEKADGVVRLNHDPAYPQNYSLNDYPSIEECKYQRMEESLQLGL